MHVRTYVRMYVCMHVYMHVCRYAYIVCMRVYMYVRTYVCMYYCPQYIIPVVLSKRTYTYIDAYVYATQTKTPDTRQAHPLITEGAPRRL